MTQPLTSHPHDAGAHGLDAPGSRTHSPSLKKLATRGSAWTILGYGGTQALRLGSNIVLAKLLTPQAFGLMSIVNVFLQGLQLFSDVGIGPSIIQNKRGDDPKFLNTAWTIQVIRGLALWGIACALAMWVAAFNKAPQVGVMIPISGLAAVIAGFNATSLFTLRRKMALGRVLVRDVVSQCVSIAVMIAWALVSPTAWALVAGGIAQATSLMVMSHVISGGVRCRFAWDRAAARDLLRFGRWVFLSTAVSFVAAYMDRLALGRLMSVADLGVYSLALMVASLPLQVIGKLATAVLFPALARRQDDPERMIRASLKARAALMWASAAMCASAAIVAPLFFTSFYSAAYHNAGEWTRWIVAIVWVSILNQSVDRALLASGRARQLAITNAIQAAGIVPAYFAFRVWGLAGFVGGMACARALAHAYLLHSLPALRWQVARQSIRATAALAAFVIGGIVALDAIAAGAPRWVEVASTLALALAPAPVAAYELKKLLREKKKIKTGPPADAPELATEAVT